MRATDTPRSAHLLQVAGEADAGQQQHRDLCPGHGTDRRRDEVVLVMCGETVVEGRATQPVTVADLDDRHAGRVKGTRDRGHLLGREPVGERMGTVTECRVRETEPQPWRVRGQGGCERRRGDHHADASASMPANRRAAMVSPTRTADAVMMSRLPAYGGR